MLVGLVHGQGSISGRYRLHTSSARSSEDGLTLRSNGRFLLERGTTVRHGDYRVRDGRLTLRLEDGDTLLGAVTTEGLSLDGVEYDRVSGRTAEDDPGRGRRFPTDAATGRLETPNVRVPTPRTIPSENPLPQPGSFGAPFSKPAVAVPDLTSPAVIPPLPTPTLPAPRRTFDAKDFEGPWTVWHDGHEEKGQRMEFKKDGKFRFEMKGATSEGTWRLDEDGIVLVYSKIDGQPLEEGASGRKRIVFSEDGTSFYIDTYRYERATR